MVTVSLRFNDMKNRTNVWNNRVKDGIMKFL